MTYGEQRKKHVINRLKTKIKKKRFISLGRKHHAEKIVLLITHGIIQVTPEEMDQFTTDMEFRSRRIESNLKSYNESINQYI